MKLFKNAEIWTMTDNDFPCGCILIDKGKIVDVGEHIIPPDGTKVIDAKGLVIMPGMIDAHCHAGMFGEGIWLDRNDGNEFSTPVTPHLRAIDSINPQDIAFKEAIEGGVTTICTGPGSINVFGGTFAILKTHGTCVDDMVMVQDYALKVALGENPKRSYASRGIMPTTRMSTAAIFREEMNKAKEYMEKKDKYSEWDLEYPEYDFILDNLEKVLRREMPLKIHAHRADDIFTAIRLADEFNVNCTLEHCTEGYLIADELKKSGKNIVLGPIILRRCKVELKNSHPSNPAILAQRGVTFCISSDSACVNVKHLSVSAGYVTTFGLEEKEALKSITIYPAKILGIDDRVGSIEVGKDADLVFLDGHLFDLESKITRVLINGQDVLGNAM